MKVYNNSINSLNIQSKPEKSKTQLVKSSSIQNGDLKSMQLLECISSQMMPSVVSFSSKQETPFEALQNRLQKLNLTTAPNYDKRTSERFGKEGIDSILELATTPEQIAIVNQKLDELEKGASIWTYDIISCLEGKEDDVVPLISPYDFKPQVPGVYEMLNPRTNVDNPTLVGPFKELHMGKSTNPEVLALEEQMAQMGYKVTYEDNLETAKIITNAYQKLTNAGFKMPKEVILMTPAKEGIMGFRPYARKDMRYETPIVFNKNLATEKDDIPFFLSELGIKHNVSDTPESVVYHEIGHFLHEETEIDFAKAHEIWKTKANDGYDVALAQEVGYYAMTGDKFNMGKEFVAEVFAGLMEGQEYSQRVMDLYNELGGPQIK